MVACKYQTLIFYHCQCSRTENRDKSFDDIYLFETGRLMRTFVIGLLMHPIMEASQS